MELLSVEQAVKRLGVWGMVGQKRGGHWRRMGPSRGDCLQNSFFFLLFRATLAAYGGCQVRG